MQSLSSFLEGRWVEGTGQASVLVNPSTEEPVAGIRPAGSLAGAVTFARERGGPALRALSFAERGELLLGLSKLIHQTRDELIELRDAQRRQHAQDAKFDIDGAIGTLAHYAELGAELGAARVLVDGERRPARALAAPRRPARPGAAAWASRCTSTRSTSRPGASPRRRRARCSPECRSSRSRRPPPRWWRTASSSIIVEQQALPGERFPLLRRPGRRSARSPRRPGRARVHRLERHRRQARAIRGWSRATFASTSRPTA